MVFADRYDAGRQLVPLLKDLEMSGPVVIALPRGGVPVGYEIARYFNIGMDIVGVRKIGAPHNPEFGIGAIAEHGIFLLNQEAVNYLRISEEQIKDIVKKELEELNRRIEKFQVIKQITKVENRTVILVDDGIATGVTAIAASRLLRKSGAREIFLTVPVCPLETYYSMQKEVDKVICVEKPEIMHAVGNWYKDFTQTTDEEVIALLQDIDNRSRQG
jgi:putative phosphoribosyl transferase